MKTQCKTAGAAVIGSSHTKNHKPCQDKVYSLFENNVTVCSLSDGAGSCSKSEIGADVCTKFIVSFLCEHFDETYKQNEDAISKLLVYRINEKLTQIAAELEISLIDLSSTLLFVAVKKDKFIAGHIGDGLIGIFDESGSKMLSPPENGEYENQTYFVTSGNALEHFRIYKDNLESITGFILMSDGPYKSLFDRKTEQLTDANLSFFSWLADEKNSQEKVEEALKKALSNIIEAKRTSDDCSINLLSTKHIDGYFDKVIKIITHQKWWTSLMKNITL